MSNPTIPVTNDTPQLLLEHHLKLLRLPTFLREYDKVARQCADAARITSAVCCLGCRHCHLLRPKLAAPDQTEDHNALDVRDERSTSVDVVASGAA